MSPSIQGDLPPCWAENRAVGAGCSVCWQLSLGSRAGEVELHAQSLRKRERKRTSQVSLVCMVPFSALNPGCACNCPGTACSAKVLIPKGKSCSTGRHKDVGSPEAWHSVRWHCHARDAPHVVVGCLVSSFQSHHVWGPLSAWLPSCLPAPLRVGSPPRPHPWRCVWPDPGLRNILSQPPLKSPGGGNPNGPQVKKVGWKTDLVEKGTARGIRAKMEDV